MHARLCDVCIPQHEVRVQNTVEDVEVWTGAIAGTRFGFTTAISVGLSQGTNVSVQVDFGDGTAVASLSTNVPAIAGITSHFLASTL